METSTRRHERSEQRLETSTRCHERSGQRVETSTACTGGPGARCRGVNRGHPGVWGGVFAGRSRVGACRCQGAGRRALCHEAWRSGPRRPGGIGAVRAGAGPPAPRTQCGGSEGNVGQDVGDVGDARFARLTRPLLTPSAVRRSPAPEVLLDAILGSPARRAGGGGARTSTHRPVKSARSASAAAPRRRPPTAGPAAGRGRRTGRRRRGWRGRRRGWRRRGWR